MASDSNPPPDVPISEIPDTQVVKMPEIPDGEIVNTNGEVITMVGVKARATANQVS